MLVEESSIYKNPGDRKIKEENNKKNFKEKYSPYPSGIQSLAQFTLLINYLIPQVTTPTPISYDPSKDCPCVHLFPD